MCLCEYMTYVFCCPWKQEKGDRYLGAGGIAEFEMPTMGVGN